MILRVTIPRVTHLNERQATEPEEAIEPEEEEGEGATEPGEEEDDEGVTKSEEEEEGVGDALVVSIFIGIAKILVQLE